jgi:1,4-alpha-glucan branching enzyme
MIDVGALGARARQDAQGEWEASFGILLPGITFPKGYRLKVRVIHERDQYVRRIEPKDFWLSWVEGSEYDRWEAAVPLTHDAGSHFGDPGRYLYRYQLLRGEDTVALWFADPFGAAAGTGTLSAFDLDPASAPFPWTDAAFRPPEIDDMVVYELNVREFNRDFDGVVAQLDYLLDLGVNTLELMPLTNVREDVEWGYTPLGYFAPDERLGGVSSLKQLVDACHGRGLAGIVDAVYAHAHPEFAFNLVYDSTGEPNPMMGDFAGEFFPGRPGMDYRKSFTIDYFLAVNRHWLAEYHVDGFRYDYVPGMYDGSPVGPGYPELVYRTNQHSLTLPKFQGGDGRSSLIQCAEHLPDPIGILSQTYSNTAWQNGLLDRARETAAGGAVTEGLAHQLDPEFLGYPTEYRDPSSGYRMPVAPFQYVESHDHARFINTFGTRGPRDLLGEAYGDRSRYYKVQPYVIALYTAKGIPMLWQGQELVENWGLPSSGVARNLFERPLHWEYFYDPAGRALVRLHRIMGSLRKSSRALRARGFSYYFADADHLRQGVIAYRREAPAATDPATGAAVPAERLLVFLNFSDAPARVWVPFARAGRWHERIDGAAVIETSSDDEWMEVGVPSNYGAVYAHA